LERRQKSTSLGGVVASAASGGEVGFSLPNVHVFVFVLFGFLFVFFYNSVIKRCFGDNEKCSPQLPLPSAVLKRDVLTYFSSLSELFGRCLALIKERVMDQPPLEQEKAALDHPCHFCKVSK